MASTSDRNQCSCVSKEPNQSRNLFDRVDVEGKVVVAEDQLLDYESTVHWSFQVLGVGWLNVSGLWSGNCLNLNWI